MNDVIESLKGNYKSEHLFALQHALDSWRHYNHKIEECDQRMELLLEKLTQDKPPVYNLSKAKPIRHHKPNIEHLHEKLNQ